MQWNRRGFLGASMTVAAFPAALAAAARPERDELVLDFEDAGGSTRNTGAQNNAAYSNAISYLSRRGGTLLIPSKVYPFSGTADCFGRNVTVLGYGATFTGERCRLTIGWRSSGYNIHGLTVIETSGEPGAYVFECMGSDCHFKDLHLEISPPAANHIGYCREETSGNLFENVSFAGCDGIILGGHDHEIRGGWGDSFGHDDCWALNSTREPCYNIRINGFRGRGFAGLVSIGSPIGAQGADNPDYDLFVKNVIVENCIAEECSYLAYIKPGAVEKNDYRDGLVEDVQILNCRHEDPTGKRFRNSVYITPSRGAIVRRVSVNDLTVNARGAVPSVQKVTPLQLRVLRTPNGAGTGSSIEDFQVSGVQCTDPFGGAPTGTSSPGSPIHSLIGITKQDRAVGRIGRVEISDAVLDGSARMAVSIGPKVAGPVSLTRCAFNNYAAAIYSSVDKGSVMARSAVTLKDITAIPSPNAPADTRGVMPDAHRDKRVPYTGDVSRQALPTIPAAKEVSSPIHSAARDSWISKVEIIAGEKIAQNDTNFVRFTLRNGGSGEILATSVTSTAGLAVEAATPVCITGPLLLSGDAASLKKNAQLFVEISHEGGGAAVVDPVFVVHSVPYGQA